MELINELRYALDTELSDGPSARLKDSAAGLSGRYRSSQPSTGRSLILSKYDVEAYAAFRMPATFAADYSAVKQVRVSLPEWSPKTLLDIGAGPGTIMWAACSVWPGLNDITLLEREESMIALGKRLGKHSAYKPIQRAEWFKADITEEHSSSPLVAGTSPFDIVTVSYVIGELKEEYRAHFIENLWQVTGGILLLIEPGTPAGFSHIKQARDLLLSSGASIITPCPSSKQCPMTDSNWCHFSQRIARSKLHKQVKSAELSYEDEKFSFVAVSRMPGKVISGRVLRHPQVRKGHIILECCTPDGLDTRVVTRKDKDIYRYARDLEWGSELPFE